MERALEGLLEMLALFLQAGIAVATWIWNVPGWVWAWLITLIVIRNRILSLWEALISIRDELKDLAALDRSAN